MSGASRPVLDELVDRMAHQLKNPLQAIIVNLEVVRLRAGREAPETWERLERFAESIDENVRLLDRRLRLLIEVSRASGAGPERVDAVGLLRELIPAAGFGDGRCPVRVEAAGDLPFAKARVGHLIGLLFRALEALRDEERGGEVAVRAHADPDHLFLDVRPPDGPRSGGDGGGKRPVADPETWDGLVRAGCEAGAVVRRVGTGGGRRLRIVLPRA